MTAGQDIGYALKFVTEFLGQVSLMLQTADKLMSAVEYECIHGSTCFTETKYTLAAAKQWLPEYIFRYYAPSTAGTFDRLFFISCLLLDQKGEFGGRFREPLISANALWFAKPMTSIQAKEINKKYWFAKNFGWALKNSDAVADGTVSQGENEDGWEIGGNPMISLASFGLPIVEITSEAELKSKVIDQMFKMADANRPARAMAV